MVGDPYESSTALEDFSESGSLPPHGLAWRRARLRLWDFLLRDKPGRTSSSSLSSSSSSRDAGRTVTEWCMTGPESLDSPTVVTAEVAGMPAHPGLPVLHNTRSR